MKFWQSPAQINPRYLFMTAASLLALFAIVRAIQEGEYPAMTENIITLGEDIARATLRCGDQLINFIGQYLPDVPYIGGNNMTPEDVCMVTGNGKHSGIAGNIEWTPDSCGMNSLES